MDQVENEGDNASFTCQATGEPVPSISWYFNGTLVDKLFNNTVNYTISIMRFNTTITNTLTIMRIESYHVGTDTCVSKM